MTTFGTRSLALMLAFALGVTSWSAPARAIQPETCMGAAEAAQELMRQKKLRGAREQLNVCAQRGCPNFVRKDCSKWAREVESSMPSAVLRAKDENGELATDVRVLVDGTVVTTQLGTTHEETIVEVDPGVHTFRFERGSAFVEETITFEPGDKGRTVEVTLETPPAPVSADGTPLLPPPPRGIPTGVFVLGGIGVLAGGSFAIFALTGASEYSDLEKSCKPDCTQAQVSGIETKFLLANVSLVIGVAAFATAGIVLLARPRAGGRSASVLVSPVPGGAAAGLGGTF